MIYLSGKITNSFYSFLNSYDFDTSRFFEMTSLEMDHLKDPHSWMNAHQVENLLNNMQKTYNTHFIDKDFITTVGHHCIHLKCWGGLDDFLKLFKTPYEVHRKLGTFFSYFINPVFKIEEDIESKNSFCFYTDFNSIEFPVVCMYFKAVLESLPLFMGGELTEANWLSNKVEIFYPHEENLPLPLKDFKKDLKKEYLINKIYKCEKNIKEFKKKKETRILDKVLKDLSDLKKRMDSISE